MVRLNWLLNKLKFNILLSKYYVQGKCYFENNTLYSGDDLLILNLTNTTSSCCEACESHSYCLSWVFNNETKICTLKSSFRTGALVSKEYTSGFLIPKCNKFKSL